MCLLSCYTHTLVYPSFRTCTGEIERSRQIVALDLLLSNQLNSSKDLPTALRLTKQR